MKSAPKSPKIHKLAVGEGHTLHIEESGNPAGIPVIALHGGPGGGLSDKNHLRYPPKTYRLIAFDQRGCGKSKAAKGILHANTTAHLVADIEKIRTHFKIEKWVVAGASWGSTLALAYAQAYPKRVLGLLLATVLLGTQHELEWFTHPTGIARFFPAEYATLLQLTGATPATLSKKTLAILTGPNKPAAKKLAAAWTMLEGLASTPTPNRAAMAAYISSSKSLLSGAQIEVHYFANTCFLKPEQLLLGAHKIAHIPTFIIHGELDFVCPPQSALTLHAALPQSHLTMLPMVGHYGHLLLEKARLTAAKKLAAQLKKA